MDPAVSAFLLFPVCIAGLLVVLWICWNAEITLRNVALFMAVADIIVSTCCIGLASMIVLGIIQPSGMDDVVEAAHGIMWAVAGFFSLIFLVTWKDFEEKVRCTFNFV